MTFRNLPDAGDPNPSPVGADSATPGAEHHSYPQQPPLPFRASKVAALPGPPAISKDDRDALLAACPHPYAVTLRAILDKGGRTGRVWASLETVAERARLSARTVKRHRAWLVASGYLAPSGGGYRGRTASYIIRTPDARSAFLEAAKTTGAGEPVEAVEAPRLFALPDTPAGVHPDTCVCDGTGWVYLVGAGNSVIPCTRGAGR
jgi:hypothetical protein